ncbi:AAA family ATPase [Clostridium paraputrificum]|uniref:ATP-dependent nuclease n=1 Tax=Clostridium paraputrificum TaxID=29363 RepID=UPI00189857B1|nr:AAA family ATPase [Clostridium paraputrificum]MDB2109784.1 AAA family ATPase [Clostridium paraputrificum]
MYISSITVENFRQLNNVTLSFEEDMTVLAGPNNSGKTTLINLLKKILKPEVFKFGEHDIPVMEIDKWFNSVFGIFEENMKLENEPEKIVANIIGKIFTEDNKMVIPECRVRFKIDYSPSDDLRNFMDYLMDLDENKYSFYFIFSLELNVSTFGKIIMENYDKLASRFKNNINNKNNDAIKDILIRLYSRSIEEKCYFTDEKYENATLMDLSKFRKLFNLETINAGRPLDDCGNENGHNLSKKLISLASKDEKWKDLIKDLPDKVLLPIQNSKIGNEVKETSTKVLNETIDAVSKTNGNYTGTIHLNMDVEEEDIESLLNKITCAKYNINKYSLDESSQGLGYSNLISMHIDLQKFIKTVDPKVVNLFFIEEPEAHMHPQMQSVFTKFLLTYYSQYNIQGLITTHSNEIVKHCNMDKLRVIRMTSVFKSEIFNLSLFRKQLVEKVQLKNEVTIEEEKKSKEEIGIEDEMEDEVAAGEESKAEDEVAAGKELEDELVVEEEAIDILENFYDWFFEIGYSEIVFADSAILYEGDTERLYIKRLITRPKFKSLKEKYIAFIQVGGAYAYNFNALISYLKIKTLIITDIDYTSQANDINDILNSNSTNSTIIKFYCKDKFGSYTASDSTKIKVEDLYKWINDRNNIVCTYENENKNKKDLIYLAFQTEKDSYSRTLEAAMLAKEFKLNAYDQIRRSEWIKKRKTTKLKFSIPNNRIDPKTNKKEKDSVFSLRDILEATSNGKTDFMYSVIMYGLDEKMLPMYIEEGLEWLMR